MFSADEAWLVFVAIAVLTALVRVFFNRWHAGRRSWWIPAVTAVGVVALALWLRPEEAGSDVTGPVAFEQVQPVIAERCATCHSGASAPLGVRLETREQIEARADDIRRMAVETRAMPPGNATGMTEEERELLGAWIAQSGCEKAANRLRELEPDQVAILVYGSFAREEAEEGSDLDLRGLTETEEPRDRYRMSFEERQGELPLHVSTSSERFEAWLERRSAPDWWTFGFPARQILRYVWATDAARSRLGEDPSYDVPAGEPELEDFVEYVGKVRALRQPRRPSRSAALRAGSGSPRTTAPSRPERRRRRARSPRGARRRPLAPHCPGRIRSRLEDRPPPRAGPAREHSSQVDGQPDIAGYLADGTLERHLGFVD